MRTHLVTVAAVFALLAAVAPATPDDLFVDIAEGVVTVKARDVSVARLLEEIALKGKLKLEIRGPLEEPVTLDLERLHLAEALDRTLRDHGFVLTGETPRTLWVFPRRSGEGHTHSSGEVGEPDEIPVRLTLDLKSRDPEVRFEATADLAAIGGPRAAALLAEAALLDEDPSIREEAVYGLGDLDDADLALKTLERALFDVDTSVREAAIEAVTEIGGDDAVRILSIALSDEDPSLREAAAAVLDELSIGSTD